MASLIIQQVFFLLGGLTVFMVGMKMMGANLEKAAGSGLRRMMAGASANRFVGIGTGTLITAIVNSSSATTVMIVGFVNIGLLSLVQATPIIMGANIGTTLSAFIMALSGGDGFSVASVFAVLAFSGLVIEMLTKSDKIKRVGAILIGVGFIFIGLNFMSNAVDVLVDDTTVGVGDAIRNIFISLGNGAEELGLGHILLLFAIGMVLTAVLQASSAITGIMIALASSGLVSINMAIFVVLGTNVGTCATSLISSIGTDTNGKRAAVIHLLFNVIGSIIFMIPLILLQDQMIALLNGITDVVKWEIAIFHMLFNVSTTLILLPFVKPLTKLATLLVPESGKKQRPLPASEYLDERLLKTPPIAVAQIRKEIESMSKLAIDNYSRSIDMLLTLDLSQSELFAETEKTINRLNTEIAAFCVKLSQRDITDNDEKKIGSFYRVISDIERIGDYAENIVEYAQRMSEDQATFSDMAKAEIKAVDERIRALYQKIDFAFVKRDLSQYREIDEIEESVDMLTNQMSEAHLERMTKGECTPKSGAIYLQLSGNLERIADHLVNIANSVKTYHHTGEV